jgi:hypothetical protein
VLEIMKHLKPAEAHAFLRQNPEAVLVDCRSRISGRRFSGLPWEQY